MDKKKKVTDAGPAPSRDTVRDAVTDYLASRKFREELRPGTQANRRCLLAGWVAECGDKLFMS